MIGYLQLNAREKYIYQCLMDTNNDSPYGLAIKMFKLNATPATLRELIKELTEASRANRTAMEIVIGSELVSIFLAGELRAV